MYAPDGVWMPITIEVLITKNVCENQFELSCDLG